MNTDELMKIVRSEKLEMPVFYNPAGPYHNATDSVVLEHDGALWKVYIVDERSGMFESTLRSFDNESDALDHVLLKLRQSKKMHRSEEIVFQRSGWIPQIIRKDGTLQLLLGAGADANHDPRTFTFPISEAHLEVIRTDFTRHLLLWSAILPLCDAAGIHDPLDESAAVALLDPILLGSEAEVELLFKEISWQKSQLIARHANIELLESGEIFAAMESITPESDWNLVREYDAKRQRDRRGVTLSPLDEAVLRYTNQYLYGGGLPSRNPDKTDPELLPQVLAIVATAEKACAGMELSPGWGRGEYDPKQKQEWNLIKDSIEKAIRQSYPTLVDDSVRTISFLMCSEAANRAKKA